MKVTTDSCLFGAWCASEIRHHQQGLNKQPLTLLDIGTGTGLLSLMIAQKNEVKTDAVEIEPATAAQAIQNISSSPYAENIHVVQADILEYAPGEYDLIVSNPPFYENEWKSPAEGRNIAHHSHLLRWAELFPLIASKLAPGGLAFLLLPASRAELANQLIASNNMFMNKEILVMQSEGRSPFRRMVCISKQKAEPVVSELVIRNEKGEYSELFTSYLQDYYLYL